MSSAGSTSDDREHALEAVAGLPPEWVAALKVRWITTAEQVLSMVSSGEGRAGLEAALPPGAPALHELIAILTEVVGAENIARLTQGSAGGPLGVVLTDEQKKRLGME